MGTGMNVLEAVQEWDFPDPSRAEPVYLEFNTNPLALVCAMLRKGKQAYEAGEVLTGVGSRITRQIDISQSIEREDVDRANEILKYFAKKHTMRRIKGEWISEYMNAIDEIANNPCRLNKEYVRIVVSLPRIYEQNRALECVMQGRKSAKKIDTLSFASWRGEVEFVERVHLKTGNRDEYHYFFSTASNHLVNVVVKKGHYGVEAWNALSKLGKLHIDADVMHTYPIKGYNFNVLQPSPEHTEIKIL